MRTFVKALIAVVAIFVFVPLAIVFAPAVLGMMSAMVTVTLAFWPLLAPIVLVFLAPWLIFARRS